MKAQLSFEFLLYITVSAVAMVSVFSIYETSAAAQGAASANVYMEELAASINGNMAYQSSSFYAYVPKSICNVTAEPMPVMSIGRFALLEYLYIANSVCDAAAGIENLSLRSDYYGAYALS